MGVERPALCRTSALEAVRAAAGVQVTRSLVYAPDAVGEHLLRRHPGLLRRLRQVAPLAVPLLAPLPPVTPVCFATMLTGGDPDAHGITGYEKPVLRCDTLFDALLRARLRVAIVTVAGSSIDRMYRERDLEHHAEADDAAVTARTLEVLARDCHELVLVYHQAHDDALHRSHAEAPEALEALRAHVGDFERLVEAATRLWQHHPHAVVLAPDHGSHVDPESGQGTHGADLPEDREVLHLWGFRPGGA
jgi:hypothetical protein